VLVDNDVNIMALGEHFRSWPHVSHMLYVKVGTGIGCGIITGRGIYRGGQGAAGDIGHIRLPSHDDVICECGNVGCLEAVAGGRALVRALRDLGHDVETSRDVVGLVRAHDLDAVRLVRQAGRDLGEVLAGLVNALNPEVIVIGGDVAGAHEQLFAGIREIVYQRSTALATRNLQIVPSHLDDRAGIIGAAGMATEHLLAPEQLDAWVNGERLTA
jgi:predicted NBD/HSP70 family sugar kinase